MRIIFIFFILIIFNSPVQSQELKSESYWHLPAKLNSQNTKISFSLDSTWHTIHGSVDDLSGNVWLKDIKDPRSVQAILSFPVKSLTTHNESRDEKMFSVMDEAAFQNISFQVTSINDLCSPPTSELETGSFICNCNGLGVIKIRDIEKEIQLTLKIVLTAQKEYRITGEAKLLWSDFGIEDPSILIATVHPVVAIHFEVTI